MSFAEIEQVRRLDDFHFDDLQRVVKVHQSRYVQPFELHDVGGEKPLIAFEFDVVISFSFEDFDRRQSRMPNAAVLTEAERLSPINLDAVRFDVTTSADFEVR